MEELVRLDSVSKSYGLRRALAGISLVVGRGETFGLIGPDGAGKTTTLRLALGLLAADDGAVRTCGVDPRARTDVIADRVGYLSQRFSLYGDLSVDENVAFFADIHDVAGWRHKRDALLERLRLAPFRKRMADKLSGGMRQKLALACTLIHTPELIVLDEPTTGVDPVSRREFWRILTELRAEGITLLLTTPYLDEAERCEKVALIDRGEILTVDTPGSIRRKVRGTIVEILASEPRRAATILVAAPGALSVETFGERLHVTVDPSAGPIVVDSFTQLLAQSGVAIRASRVVEASLEDVFIERMARDGRAS